MSDKQFLAPAEIASYVVTTACTKAASSAAKLLALGFVAGAYIALASNGSTMIAHNLLINTDSYGLGRMLAGSIFGVGLILVVAAGGELFTGNNLMVIGLLEKKITWREMLRNWLIVYTGNFLGALLIAVFVAYSGLLNASANDFGGVTIRIAASKTGLPFHQAVILGILCNMLVCLAVWMAYGAKDITGKVFACFFPIWLFVSSGFEHSIANMFYIPAGILAVADPNLLEAAKISDSALAGLTWNNFFIKNLLPVTIGNVIGGCCLIGGVYWFSYLKKTS